MPCPHWWREIKCTTNVRGPDSSCGRACRAGFALTDAYDIVLTHWQQPLSPRFTPVAEHGTVMVLLAEVA